MVDKRRGRSTESGSPAEAAEHLMARNRGLIFLLARRHFPKLAADPDLLQCGLIGLWEAARTWSGKGSFSSYAGRSILNNMTDYVRDQQKQRPPVLRRAAAQLHACEERMIDYLDMADRIKAVWPENSRERLVLLALSSGVSKHAAAVALGIDPRTLQRIAVRAMEGLRQASQKSSGK
ncbi:hypothetical protein SDC9_77411 [bioreactor metagenome]|uniref:RNA polymerase sigma-70 region 2 domain-containing protein n=1 Tax=bioreactor metagenome TaxID=1076179 RepID=A0A644YQV1_9ZZZZ